MCQGIPAQREYPCACFPDERFCAPAAPGRLPWPRSRTRVFRASRRQPTRPRPEPLRRRRRRKLLARDPAGVHARSHHHQPEQRRCSPSPRVVHEAFKRYLDLSNQAPVYHMWQILEPNIETVRRRLAAEFGCDPEEMAITRNASEALQIAQLGIDLKPGDEVVTTNQDYGRMLDTWDQRVRRDKIVVSKSRSRPAADADDLPTAHRARHHAAHEESSTSATSRTSPASCSRCATSPMAARAGIQTIVDGAHAFAHFPFKALRSRVRLLRHLAAQVAARRSAPASSTCAERTSKGCGR